MPSLTLTLYLVLSRITDHDRVPFILSQNGRVNDTHGQDCREDPDVRAVVPDRGPEGHGV